MLQPAQKRKIAVLVATGKLPDAIAALNVYLETYMNDAEAWAELAELYLARQAYVTYASASYPAPS